MSKNPAIRNIIPEKIPKKIWHSKDYSTIILYALEIFGYVYHQEFVNRGKITKRIPEKTFYNHIKRLKNKGFLEFNIEGGTRRNKYVITPTGERNLKQKLKNNKKRYGDLYQKLDDFRFFEKKRGFSEHYDRYISILNKIETQFITKISDLSHFYPKNVLTKNPVISARLAEEKKLKKRFPQRFSRLIKNLKLYKNKIEFDLLKSEIHIFESEESANFQFKCPRCKDTYIITYEKTIDCIVCRLEFEKADFKLLDDLDDILSIEEKKGILQNLEEKE